VRIPLQIPAADRRAFDVVGFGLNSVDLLAVVAEYPVSRSKQRLQRFARMPGGHVATSLAVCSTLGWRARYIGRFGDDELGDLSRQSLVDAGVDLGATRTVPDATNQFAIVLVDGRSGERTVLWDRHPALATEATDIREDVVTSGRMVIVDCHEPAAAAQAARYARAHGIPTVLDVERVRPGIADLLQNADVIIASREFPTALTGSDDPGVAIAAIGREFGASIVCTTLGAEGSLAWSQGREFRTPAFAIACVDGTGSGATFRGAFISACLRDPCGDLEDALTYANAAAALSCRALGARGSMPKRDEVDQMLAARLQM
jgi:sugar/nucleoside kinase (ribokinase family)